MTAATASTLFGSGAAVVPLDVDSVFRIDDPDEDEEDSSIECILY